MFLMTYLTTLTKNVTNVNDWVSLKKSYDDSHFMLMTEII